MSHNRDLSAAAAQIGFHNSNIGIGTDVPSETITLNHASGASIGLEYDGSEHGSLNVNSAAMYARAGSGKHLILGGNATESLRLKSDGNAYFTSNLGLAGQTSPGADIHINNFGNSGYELKVTGNAIQFNRTSSSYIDQINDTGSILFRMGSSYTEAMRITSAGNIGVGVANPTQKLMVKGIIASEATNSTNNWMAYTWTDNTFRINYNGAGSDEVTINSAGLVGINDTTPDATLSVGGSTAFVDIGAAGGNRGKIGYYSNDLYFGTSSSSGEFIFKNNVTSSDNPSSSGTVNMTLNDDGHLTLPNQPAFQATGFPSHRYMNVWQQVDLSGWNSVTQNGTHFNNTNGRFTAPVAGKYFFIFTAMYHNPSSNDFATIIKKNGSTVTLSNNISGGGSSEGHQWNDCTIQAVVNMSANDYVTFTTVGSNSSTCYLYGNGSGSTYNSASGFLIG